jgi:hypothetical protein
MSIDIKDNDLKTACRLSCLHGYAGVFPIHVRENLKEMKMSLIKSSVLLLAGLALVPAAFAAGPTIHVNGAGASSLWQPLAIAAVNDAAPTVSTCSGGVGTSCFIHHYTIKTSDCAQCFGLFDTRVSGGVTPAKQYANGWIVWVDNSSGVATDVWSHIAVDSVVGDRAFLGRGASGGVAANLILAESIANEGGSSQASDNAVVPQLFKYGSSTSGTNCGGASTCDDQYLQADVYTALTSSPGNVINAAFTDIRLEDAKYVIKRVNKPFDTSGFFAGLGYGSAGSQLVGTAILSGTGTSTASAEPDNFSLPGSTDPFNGSPVPTTITTLPVGEESIVFVANRGNSSGLGTLDLTGENYYYNDLWDTVPNAPNGAGWVTKLGKLFEGKDCSGDAAAFWNAGVVGPPPPSGGFSGANVTEEAAGVYSIISPGDPVNPTPGTVDIKFSPTAFNTLTNNGTVSLIGYGITISGTTQPSAGAFDGTYIITEDPIVSPDYAGTHKFQVTAYSAQNTENAASPTCWGVCNGAGTPQGANLWIWPPSSFANFNLHLIVREALSGTYNAVEFTSIREFGGNVGPSDAFEEGSNDANNSLSGKSQDAAFDSSGTTPVNLAATANPLKGTACWFAPTYATPSPGNGDRTRALSTGEEINGSGGGGVLGTTDSIGYTFFSFGNVTKIAKAGYGYFQLDGVDPIFNNYVNGTGGATLDPGQPNQGLGAGSLPGTLPTCSVTGGTPACTTSAIWASGNSFPHLRDGTYRAWATVRAACDTADSRCLKAGDAVGVEGLIARAQDDIHTGTSVPDFLPFSDDLSFGPSSGTGDASYYRSHFVPQADYETIDSGSTVSFWNPNTSTFGTTPDNTLEAGGDVGGCIVPLPYNNSQVNCQQ